MHYGVGHPWDRRHFLKQGALLTGTWLLPAGVRTRFLGLVPFIGEGQAPVNTRFGEELDCRLYTDLSHINEHRLTTPVNEFYIRTAASQLLPGATQWTIAIDGLIDHPVQVSIDRLRRSARPMGRHLMECAGNVRLTRFGLISVADWAGVPVMDVLKDIPQKTTDARILISGFDEYAALSKTSLPGASWIFSPEDLQTTKAFFATAMNGQPLTRDHGAPVRLVVPGWYGCSCIKWVNRIVFLENEAEATSQMREYAVRTLQNGVPQLAKDFRPPTIDPAAMPIRIEKWLVNSKLQYRVIGLAWGGSEPIRTLSIRFNSNEDFMPVPGLKQVKNDPWSLWSYPWFPKQPGTYAIQLTITDPPVLARKLDAGFYVRKVYISET